MSKQATELGRQGVALLIGVAEYRDLGLPPLPAVTSAIDQLSRALTEWSPADVDIDIRRQSNPTRDEFVRAVASASDDADGVLVVYFAGHGLTSDDGELVLAGSDCDSRHPELTGITWDMMRRQVANSGASSTLVILDACGPRAADKPLRRMRSNVDDLPARRQHHVRPWSTHLLASRVRWPYQPGVLASAVSSALSPAADVADLDGLVERVRAELTLQPPPVTSVNPSSDPVAPRFFLSYDHSDENAVSASLVLERALTDQYGQQAVYRSPRSRPAGFDLSPADLAAARAAEVMFLFIGEGWERSAGREGKRHIGPSDYIVGELAAAQEADVSIVPVLIGNRGPLRRDDLPVDLQHLTWRQYVHLGSGPDVIKVASQIGQLFIPDSPRFRQDTGS